MNLTTFQTSNGIMTRVDVSNSVVAPTIYNIDPFCFREIPCTLLSSCLAPIQILQGLRGPCSTSAPSADLEQN